MLAAIGNIYDNTRKVGCLFHITKNIYRHVQSIGLQETYVNDQEFRSNICMISALSFVAVEDTHDAFDTLADDCGELEQPVLDYFETYYIVELVEGNTTIQCFPIRCGTCKHTRVQHNILRTNNNLEGWNNVCWYVQGIALINLESYRSIKARIVSQSSDHGSIDC